MRAVGRYDRKGVLAEQELRISDFADAGTGMVEHQLPASMTVLGNKLVFRQMLTGNKRNIFHKVANIPPINSIFYNNYTMFWVQNQVNFEKERKKRGYYFSANCNSKLQ